jgi:pimeloyl-ACP methyl ester carboxylesterase
MFQDPAFIAKMEALERRSQELSVLLGDPDVIAKRGEFAKLSKELADLSALVTTWDAMRQVMITEREEQGGRSFMLQFGAMAGHALDEKVAGITAPTLILVGDQDPVAPIANSHFIQKHVPGAQLKVYEGGRHAFWVEKAGRAAADVTGFIQGQ